MLNVPDEIKELLHRDSCKKNIRITFPNKERSDICNDLIVKDSVSFTESLCSQDTLKFGLCEAAQFECETVGVGNIKGATIRVFCEIYCASSVTDAIWQTDLQAWVYQIPYGTFIVQSCDRQADMIHREIVAYGLTSVDNWKNDSFEWNKINTIVFSSSTNYIPDYFLFLYSLLDEKVVNTNLFDVINTITPDTVISMGVRCGTQAKYRNAGMDAYEIQIDQNTDMCFIDGIQENYVKKRENFNKDDAFDTSNLYIGISLAKNQIPSLIESSSINAWDTFDIDWNIVSQGVKQLPFHIYPRMTGSSNGGWMYIPIESEIFDYETLVVRMLYTDNITSDVSVKLLRLKDEYRGLLGNAMTFSSISIKVKYGSKTKTYYKLKVEDLDVLGMMNDFLAHLGMFGFIDRNGMLRLISIKEQFDLLPASNLYPDPSLYPEGVTGGKMLPNDYQKCWYNDDYAKPFGAIKVTYVNTSNATVAYTYYLSGFNEFTAEDTYKTYDLTGNSYINKYKWTEAQIETVCQIVAANIEGVTYMPVEFVGRGLPYVEAGDTFEVLTKSNDSITTIVLNRTLTGEQTLTDTYKST